MLQHNQGAADLSVTTYGERLFGIQVPAASEGSFSYVVSKSEAENSKALDTEHTKAYFKEALLDLLRKENFDVAIGGPQLADSLLFKALGLQYLKIVPEDIESHLMAYNFGMPVALSQYPHSVVY